MYSVGKRVRREGGREEGDGGRGFMMQKKKDMKLQKFFYKRLFDFCKMKAYFSQNGLALDISTKYIYEIIRDRVAHNCDNDRCGGSGFARGDPHAGPVEL